MILQADLLALGKHKICTNERSDISCLGCACLRRIHPDALSQHRVAISEARNLGIPGRAISQES